MNGKAYIASMKISQQNKPMPAKFKRSPRASMVVAPLCIGVTVAPSTTTTAQIWICNQNEAEFAAMHSTSVVWKMAGWRSRAESPNWNAELGGLVGEVVLYAGAWEVHDADGQHREHCVVAFERCRFGVLVQSGLNAICGTLRLVAHWRR